DAGVTEERLPGIRVVCLQLRDVLQHRPELDSESRDETGGGLDRAHVAKRRELLEYKPDRKFPGRYRCAFQCGKGLLDEQAQPPEMGSHAHARQDEIDCRLALAQIGEPEIRAARDTHQVVKWCGLFLSSRH